METSYLKTLELDKIIARAAEGCVCKEARAMLLAIEPQCDPDEVRYALEQTDAINTLLSDFTNNMQEDARNTILILRNYDGEDLGKFRENLSAYGAVKVRDDGGVEKLIVEVNSDNYKAIRLRQYPRAHRAELRLHRSQHGRKFEKTGYYQRRAEISARHRRAGGHQPLHHCRSPHRTDQPQQHLEGCGCRRYHGLLGGLVRRKAGCQL